MAAQTTTETVTASVVVHGVDSLGYLYGPCCLAQGYGRGEIEFVQQHPLRLLSNEDDNRCDGCGSLPAHWPAIEVTGTGIVEHTPARIF